MSDYSAQFDYLERAQAAGLTTSPHDQTCHGCDRPIPAGAPHLRIGLDGPRPRTVSCHYYGASAPCWQLPEATP